MDIILKFLFIFYYIYVLYVFYLLNKNNCSCKKLEIFKQSWNFRYITIVTPILLLFNIYSLYLRLLIKQNGGNSLYNNIIILLNIGFLFSFLNDFAIINLFHTMQIKSCPCQIKHRKILNIITYIKFVINILIYLFIITNLSSKKINKINKKVSKMYKIN